jgi:hypothetical protein
LLSSVLVILIVCYLASARWKADGACGNCSNAELQQLDGDGQQQLQAAGTSRRGHHAAPTLPPLVSSWALEAERAFWQQQPRYSTHTCISQKFYGDFHK